MPLDLERAPSTPASASSLPQSHASSKSRRARKLSPHPGARRTAFPSTPTESPTETIKEEKEAALEDGHEDEESQETGAPRARTLTGDGSIMSLDDETIATPRSFEARPHRGSTYRRTHILGLALPRWWTQRPTRREVSSFIVKLILLDAFFGLVQVGSAIFLSIVLLSNKIVDRNAKYVDRGTTKGVNTPFTLWNINGAILLAGFLGTIIFFVTPCARRMIREVNLVGSLRYMWCLFWVVPFEIYATVGMFDYHGVTDVWIKQFWTTRSMAWYRLKTCPPGTHNTLCVVPVDGLPLFTSEDEWCDFYYNNTACSSIRSAAQARMRTFSYAFYNLNGVAGILVVIMLSLTVSLLESVITKPIVQKSKESNIPLWLTLPFVGSLTTGVLLLFAPSSALNYDAGERKAWPGVLYLISAGLYFIAAMLGWMLSAFSIRNARDKHGKVLAVSLFIIILILSLLSVAVNFVSSIMVGASFVDVPLSDEARGRTACSVSPETCSFCGNDEGRRECPEWSLDDVTKVISSTLKQTATLSAIFMLYSIGALQFGFTYRKHLSMYQIDYV